MPKVRPLEVKALTPLLEQDWGTPEDLAEALILALDDVRASRTSYIAAVRSGPMLFGIGPYPGRKSAENALAKQRKTYGSLIDGGGVISIETPEGFVRRLKELDAPPKVA